MMENTVQVNKDLFVERGLEGSSYLVIKIVDQFNNESVNKKFFKSDAMLNEELNGIIEVITNSIQEKESSASKLTLELNELESDLITINNLLNNK